MSTTFLPNSNQFTHDYHLCGNAAILRILEFQPRKVPKYRGFKGTQRDLKVQQLSYIIYCDKTEDEIERIEKERIW